MMRWFAWLVGINLLLFAPGMAQVGDASTGLCVPRGPIIIDGWLGLSIGGHPNIANGVIAGDGSAGSPFLISGWLFKFGEARGAPLAAITISNTGNAHILIQDNCFENVGRVLRTENANNIALDSNVGFDTGSGIAVFPPARDITISNNTFTTSSAIDVWGNWPGVTGVKIADNTFTGLGSSDAIWLNGGSNILIERNTITGFDQGRGIYCGTCRATIANNEITGNDVGIYLGGFSSALRNVIADNRIGIQSAADTVVHYNNFDNNAEYALRDLLPPSDDDAFRHNWWGHQDGPDGDYWDTPGQEVLDVELEQVFPWLTSPNPAAGP